MRFNVGDNLYSESIPEKIVLKDHRISVHHRGPRPQSGQTFDCRKTVRGVNFELRPFPSNLNQWRGEGYRKMFQLNNAQKKRLIDMSGL